MDRYRAEYIGNRYYEIVDRNRLVSDPVARARDTDCERLVRLLNEDEARQAERKEPTK